MVVDYLHHFFQTERICEQSNTKVIKIPEEYLADVDVQITEKSSPEDSGPTSWDMVLNTLQVHRYGVLK